MVIVTPSARATAPAPAASRVAVALGGYFVVFFVGLRLVPSDWHFYPLYADLTYLPFRATACVLIWQAAKATTDPAVARGWRLLTWAQLCAITGNLTWFYTDLTGFEVENPAYIAWSVPHNALTLAALWAIMRSTRGVGDRASDWVDAGVLVVAAGLLGWFFEASRIAGLEAGDLPWVSLFVVDSASNFAIVFFAIAVRLRSPAGVSRAAITRLAGAYTLFAFADLAYEAQTATNAYHSGSWLDLVYAASVIVVALGADSQRKNPNGEGPASHRRSLPAELVVMAAAALALATLVGLVTQPEVNVRAIGGTVVGIVILVVLVLWRQRLARAEIEALVDDRIQLERQLWQAQRMETIGRLTSGVAHDFNNILASISAHAQLLQESLSGENRADAEAIEFATTRAAALTRRLLAFGGSGMAEATPVPIGALTASLGPLMRRLLPADVEMSMRLTDEDLFVVLADGQLEQIVLNLVINARDAMPIGGRLDITLRRSPVLPGDELTTRAVPSGEWAELSVADSGTGMDEVTRDRLFEPFFTTKPKEQGTGLGLATVSDIVIAAGGRITVDSAPGHGTIMRVLLPVVSRHDATSGPAKELRSTDDALTVLVVDDEEAIRTAVSRFFVRLGFRVYQAEDGVSALQPGLIPDAKLDLLITDMRMARMTGIDLARQLRQRSPRLPVVFITGFANPDLGSLSMEGSGPVIVIRKPFDLSDLAARARRLVDEAPNAVANTVPSPTPSTAP